jgi:quinol monooxygenase YgiN
MSAAHTAPSVAVVVSHSVKDFDAWKKAFDAHQPARVAAGVVGHEINRGVDDPNKIWIFLAATDRQKLEAFFANPELKATMANGGVTSPPEINWMKPMEQHHVGARATAGLIVLHEVAEYGAWKKVYDEVQPLRAAAGVIGHAVNQRADQPNHVIVYHQAETSDALFKFVESAQLKDAMGRAGVKSRPTFLFVQSLGLTTY